MIKNLASLIDHTLLKPNVTGADIEKLCAEAKQYGFFSVCINSHWISLAKKHLAGSSVKICSVAGFPLGAELSIGKALETKASVESGADEIDFVMNIGAALDARWDFIEHETHEIVSAAQKQPVKMILETAYLNPEQIAESCRRAVKAGAQFVKTSTGFGPSGATTDDVKLMRQTVGANFGVKASGGIRDKAAAEAMIAAGANRLGCSNSVAIVTA